MRAFKIGGTIPHELRYDELMRVASLSVGRYVLPSGAEDPQQPHTEDEVYIVHSGRGVLRTATGDSAAVPGAVLFVPAGEEHQFVDIQEPLEVVVVFAPPENSNRTPDT